VLWNALAPELWRRTTIALHRALGRLAGLQERELRRLVRISYAKVAEIQRRGAIHFHAVLRLDAATDCRCPGCLAPPCGGFTAAVLTVYAAVMGSVGSAGERTRLLRRARRGTHASTRFQGRQGRRRQRSRPPGGRRRSHR
jgi:hypothetical protein